jgi:hypothetical protein
VVEFRRTKVRRDARVHPVMTWPAGDESTTRRYATLHLSSQNRKYLDTQRIYQFLSSAICSTIGKRGPRESLSLVWHNRKRTNTFALLTIQPQA